MRATLLLALLGGMALGCPKSDPGETNGAATSDHASSPARLEASTPPAAEGEAAAFGERVQERRRLVAQHIAPEVDDERVLDAMRRVPRHAFVPAGQQGNAYQNRPLPIGHGQTISQPYIVAAMTAAVHPKASDRCLEIGTGSGYQAAVLAEVCATVYSIEYLPKVARFGERNLRGLGYGPDRVRLRVGDGYEGWPKAAPFNAIVVTAAPEAVPKPLLEQLAMGGRLVIPVGPEHEVQQLERWTRVAKGSSPEAFERERLMGVRFVPFLGDKAKAQ